MSLAPSRNTLSLLLRRCRITSTSTTTARTTTTRTTSFAAASSSFSSLSSSSNLPPLLQQYQHKLQTTTEDLTDIIMTRSQQQQQRNRNRGGRRGFSSQPRGGLRQNATDGPGAVADINAMDVDSPPLVSGGQSPPSTLHIGATPFTSIEGLIDDRIMKNLTEGMGFVNMTDVQAATIRPLIAGKDVLAVRFALLPPPCFFFFLLFFIFE